MAPPPAPPTCVAPRPPTPSPRNNVTVAVALASRPPASAQRRGSRAQRAGAGSAGERGKARRWLRRYKLAADGGDRNAQFNLAIFYETGNSVPCAPAPDCAGRTASFAPGQYRDRLACRIRRRPACGGLSVGGKIPRCHAPTRFSARCVAVAAST
jgi:hypothetical protein